MEIHTANIKGTDRGISAYPDSKQHSSDPGFDPNSYMTQNSGSGLYELVSSSVQSYGEQEEAKNTVHRYVNIRLSFPMCLRGLRMQERKQTVMLASQLDVRV